MSPNSKNKKKLAELRKSVAVSAKDSNERTRRILPHITYGDKVLEILRSGQVKVREDLKTQFVTDEESEES
jgi:hypothetical protein